MSSAKRKKSKHSKKRKPSKKISEVERTDLADDSRQEIVFKYALTGLLFIYLLYYLFQLYASLDNTYFWADENKHAYISSLILKNHQIPVVLPEEIYGEFQWSYPPLFHAIGAIIQGLAGFSALKFTNLFLFFIFILFFYFFILKYYGYIEALTACLIITLSPILAINTIRFTAEILSMLMAFLSFFFLLLALREVQKIFAIISGLSTGLLMLSKQTGILFLGFYFLLFLWFAWKNKEKMKILLYILCVSILVYLPYLIWAIYNRIEIFSFISLFSGNLPEWATAGVKSFRRYDSGLKEFAYLFYTGNGFLITIVLVMPLFYFIKSRFKETPEIYLFYLLFYLAIAMTAWHITNKRHTVTFLPLLAFLVGQTFSSTVQKNMIKNLIVFILLIVSFYSIYNMPNYREKFNGPEEFRRLAQIIKDDNFSHGRIFSINAFDALMYTKRPVIWPNPKLRDIPIELFKKHNNQEFYALLKKYNIKYILVNMVFVRDTDDYFGRNYPLHFMRNCEILDRQGKLALEAISKSRQWILLKII